MVYPTVNRALRFTTPGSDLQVEEKDIPPLPANEILVKVRAAAINPVDTQLWRSPLVGVVAGDKGMGRDYSGTVVAVGAGVKSFSEGDDVFGLLWQVFGQGTFSEYVNIKPASDPVAKKPNSLTHEEAASIPLVALTAYACLEWLPPPSNSQRKVIVRGASGGTGSWMVQLAKVAYNCHVTAICSSKNASYVQELGADIVIDYTSKDPRDVLSTAALESRYDLLVDCVGGTELLSSYEQIIQPKGAYVTIVGDKTDLKRMGGPITYINNPAQIIRYIKGWIWGPRYACVSLVTKSEYLEKIVGLIERGEVHAEVQEVIQGAFDERKGWKRACEEMEGGRVRGKVVLAIPGGGSHEISPEVSM